MESKESGFKDLLNNLMQKRWYVTATILGIFIIIVIGLFAGIITNTAISGSWKEILLLMLGVFSGSFNKIVDYYYSNDSKDTLLVAKMDEENDSPEMLMAKMDKGISSGQIKIAERPVGPAIPDAFVAGASAARDLAVVENKQNFQLAEDQQEHDQKLEADQQEHEQEMEKLEFEFHAHRQCEHVWGDADNDGELECQECGLLKDKYDEHR
jgi:hypothetical protein